MTYDPWSDPRTYQRNDSWPAEFTRQPPGAPYRQDPPSAGAQPPAYMPPQAQYQPLPHARPARRRQRRWGAPAAAGAVVLLAGAGAFLYIRHSAAPATCAQQYASWKSGAGKSEAAVIEADSGALTAAGKASDIKLMDAALVKMGTDAKADESHPMPACADPVGYWPQILADIAASGDNASVTPGLGGLLTAEAPLKPVKALEGKLHDELERTTA